MSSMFDSLKDKIQEGLSASLFGLSVSEGHSHTTLSSACDLNAGSDLLNYYQKCWEKLHKNAEENARRAEVVDKLVEEHFVRFETQWESVVQLHHHLTGSSSLLASVTQLMETVGRLQGQFEEVEAALAQLQETIEIQEYQEKQLDHRFQMALYKEKRLSELEQLKEHLAASHDQKAQEAQLRQQALMKERQEAFKEVFEDDLEQYRIHGRLDRLDSPSQSKQLSLDDVTLEDDLGPLHEFLEEAEKSPDKLSDSSQE